MYGTCKVVNTSLYGHCLLYYMTISERGEEVNNGIKTICWVSSWEFVTYLICVKSWADPEVWTVGPPPPPSAP